MLGHVDEPLDSCLFHVSLSGYLSGMDETVSPLRGASALGTNLGTQ